MPIFHIDEKNFSLDDLLGILRAAIDAATPLEGVTYKISIYDEGDVYKVSLNAIYHEDAGPEYGYTGEPWEALGEIPDGDCGIYCDDDGMVYQYVAYRAEDEDEDEDEDEEA